MSWIQRLLGKTPEHAPAEPAPVAHAATAAAAKVPAVFAWRPAVPVRDKLLRACEQLSEARILFERGEIAMEELALEEGGPLAACFGRLVHAPVD